jgi:hypothetical protein
MGAAVRGKVRRPADAGDNAARARAGSKVWPRRVISAARACRGIAIAQPVGPGATRRTASILSVVRDFYLGR